MRRVSLAEFRTLPAVALSVDERDALRRLHPGMRVEPTAGAEGSYDLTPDQRVGLIALPALEIEIRPKVPMSSVVFLVSYACDAADWFDQPVEFGEDVDIVEVLAIMLGQLVRQATKRGMLHGYETVEDSLQGPRGRICFDEQIRRRLGAAPPVEVRHDIYTADILENRLLLAALMTMGRMPLRSQVARSEVLRGRRLLGGVNTVHFPPSAVPDVVFTRLNQHYEPPVSLAQLILRSRSLDLGGGGVRGSAFLIDMNTVFEQFVRKALRKELGVDEARFPDRPPAACLDEAGVVPIRPDLCMVEGGRVVWIGDAKYKRLPFGTYQNADLYQLLAYAVALDLLEGTLIYAADEGVKAAEHVVKYAGKRLRIVALDLLTPPGAIRRQVEVLARKIARAPKPKTQLRR